MKEMHLLPSQTFRLSFAVALSKSLISAAVAALQPTKKIKEKLRGVSKKRRFTGRQQSYGSVKILSEDCRTDQNEADYLLS